MTRGGKRTGSGRKKNTDPTVTIRVPVSQKKRIQNWIKKGGPVGGLQTEERVTAKPLKILADALTLKANSGGKIKTEIRRAIVLLKAGTEDL